MGVRIPSHSFERESGEPCAAGVPLTRPEDPGKGSGQVSPAETAETQADPAGTRLNTANTQAGPA
ncbi:hypothetical protein GCM10027612_54610 [Microbispora bryophytorum subsp. camponoti]